MKKLTVLQLTGPITLFCAIGAAETAAYGLSRVPSSEWLWYLNLKWFSMFQQSHYALKDHWHVECEQFLCIALPLVAAAGIGVVLKRWLLLAISSNLSFVYIAFVLYTWLGANPHPQVASLLWGDVGTSNPDVIVLIVLVGLSLLSFVVSHIAYIQKARAGA
jgi:hypothetical protein